MAAMAFFFTIDAKVFFCCQWPVLLEPKFGFLHFNKVPIDFVGMIFVLILYRLLLKSYVDRVSMVLFPNAESNQGILNKIVFLNFSLLLVLIFDLTRIFRTYLSQSPRSFLEIFDQTPSLQLIEQHGPFVLLIAITLFHLHSTLHNQYGSNSPTVLALLRSLSIGLILLSSFGLVVTHKFLLRLAQSSI
jgi:hypothetical protein